MFNETRDAKARRRYRKRKRAEQEQETRRRITDALVELHGSVGPARTTVSEVAARAGVQRATVYRHFPDEPSMLAACSAHWAERNPFPDSSVWAAVRDPRRRLAVALGELYGFYERNERMLDNTTRDEPRVEALRPSMEAFRGYLRGAADVLVADRAPDGERAEILRAAVGHALSFTTWRSLSRQEKLARGDAIALMTGMIDSAARLARKPGGAAGTRRSDRRRLSRDTEESS